MIQEMIDIDMQIKASSEIYRKDDRKITELLLRKKI